MKKVYNSWGGFFFFILAERKLKYWILCFNFTYALYVSNRSEQTEKMCTITYPLLLLENLMHKEVNLLAKSCMFSGRAGIEVLGFKPRYVTQVGS